MLKELNNLCNKLIELRQKLSVSSLSLSLSIHLMRSHNKQTQEILQVNVY